MQGLFETEIFTNLILSRYFSLFQLSKQFTFKLIKSDKEKGCCLKTVNKLWYRQCKRAFFILFHKLCTLKYQKMLHIKTPLRLFKETLHFCMHHERFERKQLGQCENCHNSVCSNSLQNSLCFGCLPSHECSVCMKLTSRGGFCVCKDFVCNNKICKIVHNPVPCEGVHCLEDSSLRCNQRESCTELCLEESTELCVVCKESKFCVDFCCTCKDYDQNTYFCEAHKLIDERQCPVCQHRCKFCDSKPCDVCHEEICFNSNKVCTMLKVADKQVCIKCADTFIKSTKINKKQKISP